MAILTLNTYRCEPLFSYFWRKCVMSHRDHCCVDDSQNISTLRRKKEELAVSTARLQNLDLWLNDYLSWLMLLSFFFGVRPRFRPHYSVFETNRLPGYLLPNTSPSANNSAKGSSPENLSFYFVLAISYRRVSIELTIRKVLLSKTWMASAWVLTVFVNCFDLAAEAAGNGPGSTVWFFLRFLIGVRWTPTASLVAQAFSFFVF